MSDKAGNLRHVDFQRASTLRWVANSAQRDAEICLRHGHAYFAGLFLRQARLCREQIEAMKRRG